MDHEYAAPFGDSSASVAPFLLDHTFAKPPRTNRSITTTQTLPADVPTADSDICVTSSLAKIDLQKSSGKIFAGEMDNVPEVNTILDIDKGEQHQDHIQMIQSKVNPTGGRGRRKQLFTKLRAASSDSANLDTSPLPSSDSEAKSDSPSDALTFRPVGLEIEIPLKLPTFLSNKDISSEQEMALVCEKYVVPDVAQEVSELAEGTVAKSSAQSNTGLVEGDSTEIVTSDNYKMNDSKDGSKSVEKTVDGEAKDSDSGLQHIENVPTDPSFAISPRKCTKTVESSDSTNSSHSKEDKTQANQYIGSQLSHKPGGVHAEPEISSTDIKNSSLLESHLLSGTTIIKTKRISNCGLGPCGQNSKKSLNTDTRKGGMVQTVPKTKMIKKTSVLEEAASDECKVKLEVDDLEGFMGMEPSPHLSSSGKKRSADEAALNTSTLSSQNAEKDATNDDHAGYQKKLLLSFKKVRSDFTDEKSVLMPLKEFGWKREVVIRGVFDETKKAPCDIYYFAPDGKKLRSRVEIAQYLIEHSSSLKIENFTFVRKPICTEPWEVVRQAGQSRRGKTAGSSPRLSVASPQSAKSPKLKKVKVGRPAKPKGASKGPPASTSSVRETASSRMSYVYQPSDDEDFDEGDVDYDPLTYSLPRWGHAKSRPWGRKVQAKEKSSSHEVLIMSMPPPEVIIDHAEEGQSMDRHEDMDPDQSGEDEAGAQMVMLPDEGGTDSDVEMGHDCGSGAVRVKLSKDPRIRPSQKPTARKSTMPRIALKFPHKSSKSSKTSHKESSELVLSEGQLCSNNCPGLDRQPPELQCAVCMCLFHHKCVNVNPDVGLQTFKCLRCEDLPTHSNPPTTETQPPVAIPPPPLTTRPETSVSESRSNIPRFLVDLNEPPPLTAKDAGPLPLAAMDAGRSQPISLQHGTVKLPGALQSTTTLISGAIGALHSLVSAVSSVSTSQPLLLPRTSASPAPPRLLASEAAPPLVVRGVAPPPLTPSSKVITGQKKVVNIVLRPPPRLTAAPGMLVSSSANLIGQPLVSPSISPNSAFSAMHPVGVPSSATPSQASHAQLLTLPSAVVARLNLSQPLALKINNAHIVVPPSCVINSTEGLKVLLPPCTFPLPTDPNAKLSVTVSNSPVTSSFIVASTITPSSSAATCSTRGSTTITNSGSVVNSSSVKSSSCIANSSVVTNIRGVTINGSGTPDNGTTQSNSVREGVQTRHHRQKASTAGIDPSQCMMHRLFGGFDSMLHIFRYLGVLDLLRASQVCKTWLRIVQQHCLWQHVSLEGLQVPDWDKAARFLQDRDTRSLSLKGMCHYDTNNRNRTWHQLMGNLSCLLGLQHMEFGQVPPSVIHSTAEKLSQLQVFRAEHITDFSDEQMWTTPTKVDVGKFASLSNLRELRLRGVSGLVLPTFTFSGKLSELTNLKNLHTLSLTSLCALRDSAFHFLGEMQQLEVLELGDCLNWTSETYTQLGQLHKLRRLRLEVGGDIPDVGLSDAVVRLINLEHLELILFAIPNTLGSALNQLPHLHTLVVCPDTGHDGMMPALVNSHAMSAVCDLQQLETLEWGVVIRNEGDTASDPAADTNFVTRNNVIPLLKPEDDLDPEAVRDASAVWTVSVTEFTQILCQSLPECTRIKVFNTQVVGRAVPTQSS